MLRIVGTPLIPLRVNGASARQWLDPIMDQLSEWRHNQVRPLQRLLLGRRRRRSRETTRRFMPRTGKASRRSGTCPDLPAQIYRLPISDAISAAAALASAKSIEVFGS